MPPWRLHASSTLASSALEQPLRDYAERARAALAPFSRVVVDRIVADDLLPRLLA
jgi:hypothetical protein